MSEGWPPIYQDVIVKCNMLHVYVTFFSLHLSKFQIDKSWMLSPSLKIANDMHKHMINVIKGLKQNGSIKKV